jgi:hypothetical protein
MPQVFVPFVRKCPEPERTSMLRALAALSAVYLRVRSCARLAGLLAPATHYHFSALAAASLYSDLTDIAGFAIAHLPGEDGAPPGRGVLPPETLVEMETFRHAAGSAGFGGGPDSICSLRAFRPMTRTGL